MAELRRVCILSRVIGETHFKLTYPGRDFRRISGYWARRGGSFDRRPSYPTRHERMPGLSRETLVVLFKASVGARGILDRDVDPYAIFLSVLIILRGGGSTTRTNTIYPMNILPLVFAVILSVVFSGHAEARLGWTMQQCKAKYGPASIAVPTGKVFKESSVEATFQYEGWRILVAWFPGTIMLWAINNVSIKSAWLCARETRAEADKEAEQKHIPNL